MIFVIWCKQKQVFTDAKYAEQVKLGTALFHAYAHNWGCQLEYNPRLNVGWGKSNGEGMERVWMKNAPLVKLLRYATKHRRLVSLDLWNHHRNEDLRKKAGKKETVFFFICNHLIIRSQTLITQQLHSIVSGTAYKEVSG